jgi:hypothetical protein
MLISLNCFSFQKLIFYKRLLAFLQKAFRRTSEGTLAGPDAERDKVDSVEILLSEIILPPFLLQGYLAHKKVTPPRTLQ